MTVRRVFREGATAQPEAWGGGLTTEGRDRGRRDGLLVKGGSVLSEDPSSVPWRSHWAAHGHLRLQFPGIHYPLLHSACTYMYMLTHMHTLMLPQQGRLESIEDHDHLYLSLPVQLGRPQLCSQAGSAYISLCEGRKTITEPITSVNFL